MESKDIKSEILKKLEGLKEKILSFFFKRNAKKITSLNDKNELIVEAIFLIRNIVNADSETNMSTVTKSAALFEKAQQIINNMTERCSVNWE